MSLPVDGRHLRDRPLTERFETPRHFVVRPWQGPGILRVAPTGVPWSVWTSGHHQLRPSPSAVREEMEP